jgi:hypothetical protein
MVAMVGEEEGGRLASVESCYWRKYEASPPFWRTCVGLASGKKGMIQVYEWAYEFEMLKFRVSNTVQAAGSCYLRNSLLPVFLLNLSTIMSERVKGKREHVMAHGDFINGSLTTTAFCVFRLWLGQTIYRHGRELRTSRTKSRGQPTKGSAPDSRLGGG